MKYSFWTIPKRFIHIYIYTLINNSNKTVEVTINIGGTIYDVLELTNLGLRLQTERKYTIWMQY